MLNAHGRKLPSEGRRGLAVSDPQHHRKHLNAAEAWLILASKLEEPNE